jgi:septal ring factor EnvC (AmiA/AmiB activator)
MRNARNRKLAFFIGVALIMHQSVLSQISSEKLRREQDKLENKISNTKSLLNKTKTNTEASLNELKIIDNQIKFREELLSNFDNQIKGAEIQVSKKDLQIKQLHSKLKTLKIQYKKMLMYAYKHRNKYGKMMYIFAADNYYQALKRNKYLEKISDVQQKQFLIIKQHQGLIKEEISSIEKERQLKLAVLEEKKKEKELILKDKEKQQQVYQNFKSKENELITQLNEDERKKEVLKDKINAAIRKEIAEATIKAGKIAAEAKKKKEEMAAKKKTSKKESTTNKTEKTEVKMEMEDVQNETASKKEEIFTDTKESLALGKSFESNKGSLPWPVNKGTITERFGKNAHPTLDNVYTNNSGIDISAPKSAQVRSVFEGEVTSVLNIPGAGKVVIIKHGNYRTVYTNLQNTYVTAGSKVTTKQAIGSLVASKSNSVSVAHFEIHQVNGSSVQCINPALWVSH